MSSFYIDNIVNAFHVHHADQNPAFAWVIPHIVKKVGIGYHLTVHFRENVGAIPVFTNQKLLLAVTVNVQEGITQTLRFC